MLTGQCHRMSQSQEQIKVTTSISRRRRSGQGQDWTSAEWTGCGTSLPYRAPFSECRDAAQGLQPASPTSLTHSLALTPTYRPDIIIILTSISDIQLLFVRARNSSSPVLTPLLAPLHRCCKASAPRCFVWAKGRPMCGAVNFTIHINSPIAPGASSSSSQLTVFHTWLQVTFLQYTSHPSLLNHQPPLPPLQ